jgi:hypothetical protein
MITLCICGLQIVAMDASAADPVWIHRVNTTSCKEPTPGSVWTVTKYDRVELSAQWAEVGPSLDRAAIEMSTLRQQMNDVDASLSRMEARLVAPAVVRRATLNQVWDRLVDSGEMAAARIVMDMIKRVVDQ